jgi:hypothetical protein
LETNSEEGEAAYVIRKFVPGTLHWYTGGTGIMSGGGGTGPWNTGGEVYAVLQSTVSQAATVQKGPFFGAEIRMVLTNIDGEGRAYDWLVRSDAYSRVEEIRVFDEVVVPIIGLYQGHTCQHCFLEAQNHARLVIPQSKTQLEQVRLLGVQHCE